MLLPIALAGLLLILANPMASVAENVAEVYPPIPAGQWAVIAPPLKFDPEIARTVISDNAPEGEWPVHGHGFTAEETCHGFLAYAVKHARDTYLDDPNSTNHIMLRDVEQARCIVSDGSARFRPVN